MRGAPLRPDFLSLTESRICESPEGRFRGAFGGFSRPLGLTLGNSGPLLLGNFLYYAPVTGN